MEGKVPPILPVRRENSRRATALNLFLPGAGLFYVGWRKLGAILAVAFLGCALAALAIFLNGYAQYLNTVMGNELLKEGQLEHLQNVFHTRWLLVLLVIALGLYVFSAIAMVCVRRRNPPSP